MRHHHRRRVIGPSRAKIPNIHCDSMNSQTGSRILPEGGPASAEPQTQQRIILFIISVISFGKMRSTERNPLVPASEVSQAESTLKDGRSSPEEKKTHQDRWDEGNEEGQVSDEKHKQTRPKLDYLSSDTGPPPPPPPSMRFSPQDQDWNRPPKTGFLM